MANENYGIALGMIETRGLVPAIEAADAMMMRGEPEVAVGVLECHSIEVGARQQGKDRLAVADGSNRLDLVALLVHECNDDV